MNKDELKCWLLAGAVVVVGIMTDAALIWNIGFMFESLLSDSVEGGLAAADKATVGMMGAGGGGFLLFILLGKLERCERRMLVDARRISSEGGEALETKAGDDGADAMEREERSTGESGGRERSAAFSDEIVELVAFARACDGAAPEIARACRDRAALLAGRRVVEDAERRGGANPDAARAPLVGGGGSCENGRRAVPARARMARRKVSRRVFGKR